MICNRRFNSGERNSFIRKVSREKKGVVLVTEIGFKTNFSMIKRYMSLFGKLERVFLVGNFSDWPFNGEKEKKAVGWIEFSDKKDAKQAVLFSKNCIWNTNDLKNLKIEYLRNFEWQEIIKFYKNKMI